MKDNLKSKISTLFIIILMILSTLLACNVLAEELEEEIYGKIIVRSEHIHNYPDGTYIPYSDLNDYYDVFCCQKGTSLPSINQTKFTANGVEYSFPYLTMNDIGMTIGTTTTTDGSPFDGPYTHKTIGLYKIEAHHKATPEEAYILSEMIKVDGMGEYNECQLAWWKTEAGSEGNSSDVATNALSLEARAFEEYIKQVSEITKGSQLVESDCKYKTAKFTDQETGEKFEIENAFDFEYKPEWNYEGDCAHPTVMYDQTLQAYTVGPFAIDYIGETTQFGDREQVQFAGITGMELYTDASDDPLILGTEWEIICAETVRCDDIDYEFPKSGEEFYIKLNYIDGATQITNIKTHFRYMNAAGEYDKLQGKYFIATWEEDSKDNKDEEGDVVSTTYWLELTDLEEHDSQKLALGLSGARWYEYMDIDRSIDIKSKSIKIIKEVVNKEGNKLDVKDFFDFNVEVSGAINSGRDRVRARANKSVTTATYYWMAGEATPTYSVEEIPTDGYRQVSIENATGSLDSKDPIVVKVVNEPIDEHTGKLQITKEIQKSTLDSSKFSFVGKQFKFKVTVSGTFNYEGKEYKESSITLYPEVTAVLEGQTGSPWVSNDFTWYDEEAPVFTVEEIEVPEGAELVSIVPSAGVLSDDSTVEVKALNKQLEEQASIEIIKRLENSDYLSEEEIKALEFYFTIHVDGYDDVEVIAKASREEVDGKYEWVWRGDKAPNYTWLYGNAPAYTITEHDNPKGTTLVSASSDSGDVSLGGQTVSGTLVANKDKKFIIKNTLVNRYEYESNKGNLELTKIINDTARLKNRDYSFIVTLSGKFRFEGESEEFLKTERVIQFTNDSYVEIVKGEPKEGTYVVVHIDETNLSNTWSTAALGKGQIEWYGNNAPVYTVEEDLAGTRGEYIKYATVTPSAGALTKNEPVKVKAENYGDEEKLIPGKIKIIKTLENAEKYDANYINSLVFKFRVEVNGYDPYTVELKANRVADKYVWEYTSNDFFWKEGEAAPTYTIEEVDLPAGTEFVSAKGPDGSSVSGTKISGTLLPGKNGDIEIYTENSFINKLQEIHEGKISIKKVVTHDSLNGKDFKFTLKIKGTFTIDGEEVVNGEKTIEDISVAGGSTWSSGTIKWAGENAPQYSVTEAESEIAKLVNVINGSGTVTQGDVNVTFINEPIKLSGRLKIHKIIKDQPTNSNDKFTFRISVSGQNPIDVAIKADETYTSQEFTWFATEEAPTYKVEEVNLPKGAKFVSLSNESGSLVANETIAIEAVNQYDVHRGRFILEKVVVEDKINPEQLPTFQFKVSVTGEFSLSGDESTTNTVWEENPSITGNGTYESPEFVWYGDEPPVVHVEELNVEGGSWKLLGISNNDAAISENETLKIVATNQYNPGIIIDLTMEMGGTVWNDTPLTNDKNMEGSTPNGKLDMGESGIGEVEVYIYKAGTDELATIYADSSKNEIEQPLITSGDGKWSAPRVPVLKEGTYDIKFVYDGQTFEPTTPLVTGSAESYKGSSNTGTSGRSAWLNDSMADDVNREEVNSRLTEIKGNTPIDGAGNTVGTAVGGNGEASILYEKSSGENESRIASKVITKDKNGKVLELYKTEARTSQVGLTYPFDQRMHLEDFDIIPSELGVNYRYLYSATYPYTLHINLGLVKRDIADVDAIKDLVEAKVVVNERLLTYKFNKLADVGKDVLTREAYLNGTDGNNNMKYQLGFYKTDYYYRAEIYKSSKVYDYMQDFYKNLGQTLDATNLEVYLKYRIAVYNESPNYQVTINEVADYFDSSFGEPIKEEVKKYVQTIDGKETNTNELETVAKASYVEPSGAQVNWNIKEQGINGSDGVTYNKMTTDALKGMRLASGEKAEMYVYFKVQPTTVEGISNTIELASKSNIVEISNYSTYNSDGSIAGKIDVDSAPDNANIREYNSKAFYEDDTDSAPILQLKLYTENAERSISGYAWEDKPEKNEDNNTVIGNGLYDEGDEALIGGLTTELVEKVKVPQEGGYAEYDFLWPTNENLACLGGRTVEELTGFDSTTETSREVGDGEGSKVGSYEFKGIPVGNYIVRFMYGNDKSELDDTFGITGDPVALNADSSKFATDENILVANYDEDTYKTTAAVYNGQDFKSTLYQANNSEEKTEWHNLKDYTDYNTDSDFVENEARRLEAMANTTVITNVNGTVLATANNYSTLEGNDPANYDASANHAELYENTYMISDSGKINFNLENIEINSENSAVKNYEIETVETASEDGAVKVIAYERANAYEINDVAFGLIRRAETNIVLDKEIKTIKLTTNDNRVIFDAEYDIDYKVESLSSRELADKVIVADLGKGLFKNKYLVAEVKLSEINSIGTDVMQALDKAENKLTTAGESSGGTQNFRFINVDDTILQGTTIEIGYQLTALNVGETDTVSPRLAHIATEEILDDAGNVLSTASKIKLLAQEVETERNTFSSNPQDVKTLDLGKYVGRAFYTGNISEDEVVTTRVRQVVDYVDTDGTFATTDNDSVDHSWRNTTINELLGNGYEADRLVETSLIAERTSVDKNGIEYITDQRNNIVLSIDNYNDVDELNNSGFERTLYPYAIANSDEALDYKSNINLTITKTVSATDDADNLAYDNIAEIVKYENVAGRRDEATIPGNANPEVEQFEESLQERDQSATELVTFTPPTGLEVQSGMTMQILIITVIALGVLAIGIVIIKKTVLK